MCAAGYQPIKNELLKLHDIFSLSAISDVLAGSAFASEGYRLFAKSEMSQFNDKESLKRASNMLFASLKIIQYPQAYIGLAYLFILLNDHDMAEHYLKACIEIDPFEKDVKSLLDHIKRNDPKLIADYQRFYTEACIYSGGVKTPIELLVSGLSFNLKSDEKMQLCDLPDDVLLTIFSYLDIQELITISLVSKNFNALSNDPTVWDNLYKGTYPYNSITKIGEPKKSFVSRMKTRINYLKNNFSESVVAESHSEFQKFRRVNHLIDTCCYLESSKFVVVEYDRGENKLECSIVSEIEGESEIQEFSTHFSNQQLNVMIRTTGSICLYEKYRGNDSITKSGSISTLSAGKITKTLCLGTKSMVGLVGNQFGEIYSISNYTSLKISKFHIQGLLDCSIEEMVETTFGTYCVAILQKDHKKRKHKINLIDMEKQTIVSTFDIDESTLGLEMHDHSGALLGYSKKGTMYYADFRIGNMFEVSTKLPANTQYVDISDKMLVAASDREISVFDVRYNNNLGQGPKLYRDTIGGICLMDECSILYASPKQIRAFDSFDYF